MGNSPQYLIVSGIDGSGKTTIIERLMIRLEADGIVCLYRWMRYTHIFVRPLHALAKLGGLSRRHSTPLGTVWRHEFYRFPIFAWLYIPLTWLDTWVGKARLALLVHTKKPDIIICDRWVNDILIDMAVDFRDPCLLSRTWSKRFRDIMPLEAKQFLIRRDTGAVVKTRPESIHDPGFSLRNTLYDKISADLIIIENEASVDSAVDQILVTLRSEIPRKTRY
jgi:hypothetical protein